MAEKKCPLLNKACIEHKCRWYIQLMGKHPQTGAAIGEWGCAVEWLPVLMIEQSQEIRQSAAAVESLRNENVRVGEKLVDGLHQAVTRSLTHKRE